MSSMTLKQFMTREKRADYYRPPEGGAYKSYDKNEVPKGYYPLSQLPIDMGTAYNDWSNMAKSNELDVDTSFGNFLQTDLGKPFFSELERVVYQFGPAALNGDKRAINSLTRNFRPLVEFWNWKNPDQQIPTDPNEMMRYITENMDPGLLNIVTSNPELLRGFGMRPLLKGFMKALKMDTSKLDDLAPGLKTYDMNQHLPGMAAAFGIPMAVGTLLGKPGWGLLLGMLGAGGYGYYQYNKMKANNNPLSSNYSPYKQGRLPKVSDTGDIEALPPPTEKAPVPASSTAPASDPGTAVEMNPSNVANPGTEDSSEELDLSDEELPQIEQDLEVDPESASTPTPAPNATPAPTSQYTPKGIPSFIPGKVYGGIQYA